MPDRRLGHLRSAIGAMDREASTIDERLAALAQPLESARAEFHRTFAALPGTARSHIAWTAGSNGGERTRLHRQYHSAERAWNTLASEERRLRARRTELTACRHEAITEHRVLFQRLGSPRVVEEGETEEHGARTNRRAG